MNSEIKEFYKGANVLITGATGLIGQLLLEKLLRECSDIAGIYLIVRRNRGKSALERISKACENPLFEKLRGINPKFADKIHVFDGDCSQLQLGLDNPSRKILIENVNVVFHSAALVNFDGKLKDAVDTNVRGLKEVLEMCHCMPNLKSMVFVSTAYSQCQQKVVEEKFYAPPLQPDTIINLRQETDSDIFENMTPQLLGRCASTYCFTKSIAEELICKESKTLPVALFRPSAVMSTLQEPVPGWTSNIHGVLGYFLAIKTGLMRIMYCNPNVKIDIIPADKCANTLICAAWETHINFKSPTPHLPVYNCSGGIDHNMTIENLIEAAQTNEIALKNVIWAVNVRHTRSKILYRFLRIWLHYLPGCLFDLFLLISGKKPRIIKDQQRLSKFNESSAHFVLNEWVIINENVVRLWNRLNETDKKLFPFNTDVIDYKRYLNDCVIGLKLYVLKESLENLENDKLRYQRLVKIHKTLKLFMIIVIVVLFVKFYSMLYY